VHGEIGLTAAPMADSAPWHGGALSPSISPVTSKGWSMAAHGYEATGWSAHSRGECSGCSSTKVSTLDTAMGWWCWEREAWRERWRDRWGFELLENHQN